MAQKVRVEPAALGVVGFWGCGRVSRALSYELGGAVPGIVGVANPVLKAMLMGGARTNCATHYGRRPGFQEGLCVVDKATPHAWSYAL